MAMSFDNAQSHLKDMEENFSEKLSLILPQFAFTNALMTYYSNKLMIDQCQRINRTCTDLGKCYILAL